MKTVFAAVALCCALLFVQAPQRAEAAAPTANLAAGLLPALRGEGVPALKVHRLCGRGYCVRHSHRVRRIRRVRPVRRIRRVRVFNNRHCHGRAYCHRHRYVRRHRH